MVYQLALTPELFAIYDVFHISMLKRFVLEPTHHIKLENLEVNNDLTYEERPIIIFRRKIKTLRNRDIPLVLVQWNRHGEATWEREGEILSKYPELLAK